MIPRAQHHAPPAQTIAQKRIRLTQELAMCTDARLAAATIDALSTRYRGIPVPEISRLLADEKALRKLSPQERFDRMLEGVR